MIAACVLFLLYGLFEYQRGRKGIGTFIFFFFLTEGFHFLSRYWISIKYTDFALVYLLSILLFNFVKRNELFFKTQFKIYKVACFIGIFITIEFIRTILLKEEIFSLALANYRTYIPFFSFFLVQELKQREIERLLKVITTITVISTVLYVLQPILGIKILKHANIGAGLDGISRYRNIPYLVYFYLLYTTVLFRWGKGKLVILLTLFITAILLAQHRAVMVAYVVCVALYLLFSKKKGRLVQFGVIGLLVVAFAGDFIVARFERKNNNNTTMEDIQNVLHLDYNRVVADGFENEGGTLSFRILLLTERIEYMINNPKYLPFGIGTRHEDSPLTQNQFDFVLGTYGSDGIKGQISSGDLQWINPLMRFGFVGIALFLYFSYLIVIFLYGNCRNSMIAMGAFMFYLFLLLLSFKNDHLYGNMQLFFVFLLIEYIRRLKEQNELKLI